MGAQSCDGRMDTTQMSRKYKQGHLMQDGEGARASSGIVAIGYPLDTNPDDEGMLVVTCPAFPEVGTSADNTEDALVQGRDVILMAISGRIFWKKDIALPVEIDATQGVELSALIRLKIALYMACRRRMVTWAELGRRLGWHSQSVARLFQLSRQTRISQLEEAFRAIGAPMSFSFPDPGDRRLSA